MMQHRNFLCIILTPPTKHLCIEEDEKSWCGVESLSDIETANFKALIKLNTATALKTYWSFDDRLKISVRHVVILLMCVGLYIMCLLVRHLGSIRHLFASTI